MSTIEPGRKRTESENGDSLDSSVVNGDLSLDVNVDIDMDGEGVPVFNAETQNGNGKAPAVEVSATEADAAVEADEMAANNKEKPVTTEKHVAVDDDILPNPKKAKLDLGEDIDISDASEKKSLGVPVAKEEEEKETKKEETIVETEKDINMDEE